MAEGLLTCVTSAFACDAANQLGLSTQVPSNPTYMTDWPTRTKKIGRHVIQFRNATPKTLVGAGSKTGTVFQALRYVGKDSVTDPK